MLKAALRYAELGWYVFPCSNKDKRPIVKNGFHDATRDIDQITHWWTINPKALIAVACGKSGIDVIDIDNKDNRNGYHTWDAIKHDDILTVQQITQSGGTQLIFKHCDAMPIIQGSDVNGYLGIDTRNQGGYIIVAPSVMANGNKYDWISEQSPEDMQPVEFDPWLYKLFADNSSSKREAFKIPERIEDGHRDTMIFKMACSLKTRNDMDQDQVLAAVMSYNQTSCFPPLSDNIVRRKVESAFTYSNVPREIMEGLEELEENSTEIKFIDEARVEIKDSRELKWDYIKGAKGDKPKMAASFRNAANLLQSAKELFGVYRYNEFNHDIEMTKYYQWMSVGYPGKSIDDNDVLTLKHHILDKYSICFSINTLHEAIGSTALKNPYHPVKNYLNSLKWDGQNRLDNWLSVYMGVDDSKYSRFVGKTVLTAACMRIDRPGIKYDDMVILEGGQGIGKSQAVSILGGEWFAEIPIMARDKDTIDKMRGKWFVEVPEMVSFRKQEIESLKCFLSTGSDRVRLAYARKAKDFPRQCVFICTLNPDTAGYLKDTTGNRRFFPVRIGTVDLPSLRRDRDQLFAEAWKHSKTNPKLYTDDQVILLQALEEQSGREVVDERAYMVLNYLKTHKHIDVIRGVEVFTDIIGGEAKHYDWHQQRTVSGIMRCLKWDLKTVRKEEGTLKAYKRPAGFLTKSDFVKEDEPKWEE